MKIRYVTGDATVPLGSDPKIIVHLNNDVGAWGAGFVLAVSRRWPQPERDFRAWYAGRTANDFRLGAVQLVEVDAQLWVANLVGQHGIRRDGGKPPVRYKAIAEGLVTLTGHAHRLCASVHMPRIGCGLAGGNWDQVERLISGILITAGVPVTVYDLPSH